MVDFTAIDREIRMLKSGSQSGDFMRRPGQKGLSQTEQRMIRALEISKLSPAERQALKVREAEAARESSRARALAGQFSANVDTLTKARTNANIEKLRALSLDDANPDQWLLFNRAVPMRTNRGKPLGKFRFNWGANGKPVYVPWTEQSWINFFRHPQRGRWIPNQPFMHKCPPEWETHWIGKYWAESQKQARYGKYQGAHDKRKVWQHTIGAALCKKPKKSLWVKIRKVVVGAAIVVAAVYLGPIIVAKVKSVAGGMIGGGSGGGGTAAAAGGSSASTAATTATTFQKVQAGTKTLLGYVNKARTIEAVVKGELPPPPIGIPGASFRDWAMIVAKQKIKDEAMDAAMEAGQKYIAKKMSQKEEAALKAEIAEMQRQLIALTPKEVLKMPPEPMPELAAPIKKIQKIEEKRADDLEKFIVPGAIVAGALLLGG